MIFEILIFFMMSVMILYRYVEMCFDCT